MLKAVIVDGNATSRSALGTVLTDGSYNVVGTTNTSALGYALALKHRPHIVCIALEQVEDGNNVVEQLRIELPKTLIFIVSSTLDAQAVQRALARGVHGFIVKPFKADTVLKTIRNTVVTWVKKQQKAAATSGVDPVPPAAQPGAQPAAQPAAGAAAAAAPDAPEIVPVRWVPPGAAAIKPQAAEAAPVRWTPPTADD